MTVSVAHVVAEGHVDVCGLCDYRRTRLRAVARADAGGHVNAHGPSLTVFSNPRQFILKYASVWPRIHGLPASTSCLLGL